MKKIYTITLLALTGLINISNAQTPGWQWAREAGGVSDEAGTGIKTDASGNIYTTGTFSSAAITLGSISLTNTGGGGGDIYVAKYDPSGNVIWAKNFGGTNSYNGNATTKGIDVDASGNIFITGVFYGTGMTFGSTTLAIADTSPYSVGDIFVAKLDGSGNALWAKSAGGAVGDGANAISVDASGNSYITGYFVSSAISFGSTTLNSTNNTSLYYTDIFIAKYDASGNFVWAKNTGGSLGDIGNGISTDQSGNVIVTGTFNSSSIAFGSTTLNATAAVNLFLVKYDSGGNVVWAQTAIASGSGSINHAGTGVSTDAANNVYMTGSFGAATLTFGSFTLNNIGGSNTYVIKFDPSGNALWGKVGGIGGAVGTAIEADAAGNTYATGYIDSYYSVFDTDTIYNFNTSGYNEDIFVVKYNTSGVLQWVTSAGGIARDISNAITADPSGNAIVTGYFKSTTMTFGTIVETNYQYSYDDMFIAKMGTPAGINEFNDAINISVYPNPSFGAFLINTQEKNASIEIVDLLGEVIYSGQMSSSSIEIDLKKETKGIYFIRMITEEKRTVSKKIILQ